MADRYSCFAQLAAGETRAVDYDVIVQEHNSTVSIIAPHGGHIEPHTTLIAEKIAGDSYNFYTFSGLIPGRPHGDLHITSVKFDEPECLRIVGASKVVVAIHGRADKLHDTAKTVDPKTIFMGGLDVDLRDSIADRLNRAGFQAKAGNPDYPGEQPFNICNRGRNKGGVQLEIPRTLRNDLQLQPNRLSAFASAVRQAMESRP